MKHYNNQYSAEKESIMVIQFILKCSLFANVHVWVAAVTVWRGNWRRYPRLRQRVGHPVSEAGRLRKEDGRGVG